MCFFVVVRSLLSLCLNCSKRGGHEIGLHLENSRSLDTFREEIRIVEEHCEKKVRAVSKHGSGGAKFGFHHYAPYEPEKYIDWSSQRPCECSSVIWKIQASSLQLSGTIYWFSRRPFGSNPRGETLISSRWIGY